ALKARGCVAAPSRPVYAGLSWIRDDVLSIFLVCSSTPTERLDRSSGRSDPSMDVLTDVLESIHTRTMLLGRLDLTAPWGLLFDGSGDPGLAFFVVTRGSAVLETEHDGTRWLSGGDFVLLRKDRGRMSLRDSPASPAVPVSDILAGNPQRRDCQPGGVFCYGGGGPLTSVIGGRIEVGSLTHNPLLRA